MVIKCKYCNKDYASYSSRSNHIKKYHNVENIQKIDNDIQKIDIDIHENIQKCIYKCEYCKKEYATYFIKWRHEKNCKMKENNVNKMDKLEKQLEELKDLIQKSMKIHPPDLLEKSKIFLIKSDRPN